MFACKFGFFAKFKDFYVAIFYLCRVNLTLLIQNAKFHIPLHRNKQYPTLFKAAKIVMLRDIFNNKF